MVKAVILESILILKPENVFAKLVTIANEHQVEKK